MNSHQIYESLRTKYLNKTFSQQDANQLVELAEHSECNLEVLLLTIECSHYLEAFFLEHWTQYYQLIVESVSSCLGSSSMAQIHSLASTLYEYDQDKEMARQAIRSAFELDKSNVRIVFSYVLLCWEELTDTDRKALIDNLPQLDPDSAFTYFAQGWLYNSLAKSIDSDVRRKGFLELSILAYKKSIALGLNQEQHRFPAVAATSEIQRIEGLLTKYD